MVRINGAWQSSGFVMPDILEERGCQGGGEEQRKARSDLSIPGSARELYLAYLTAVPQHKRPFHKSHKPQPIDVKDELTGAEAMRSAGRDVFRDTGVAQVA
jgi:hypothetical protein